MDIYACADAMMALVHLPYTLVYAYLAWQRNWTPPARVLHVMLLCFWLSGFIFHATVALAGPESPWRVTVLYVRVALAAPLAVWAWPIVKYIAVLPMLPTLAEYERLARESRERDAAIDSRNRKIEQRLMDLRTKAVEWGREHQYAVMAEEIRTALHEIRNVMAVDKYAAALRRMQEKSRGHLVTFERGAIHDTLAPPQEERGGPGPDPGRPLAGDGPDDPLADLGDLGGFGPAPPRPGG
jgi:hypothetical protein